ncbi:MAG: type II toxin-antitoxin system VapC family toxin [Pseudonocardiaceae bacterium]
MLRTPVIAEVGYFLAREASADVESSFLRSLADGSFKPVELASAGYARMADLVDQYGDLPLGTTDAAVVALAERLDVDEIATIDHRHFTVVRPRHAGRSRCCPDESNVRPLWTRWESHWCESPPEPSTETTG